MRGFRSKCKDAHTELDIRHSEVFFKKDDAANWYLVLTFPSFLSMCGGMLEKSGRLKGAVVFIVIVTLIVRKKNQLCVFCFMYLGPLSKVYKGVKVKKNKNK